MVIDDDAPAAGGVPLSQPTMLAPQELGGGGERGTQLYPLASEKRYAMPLVKKDASQLPSLFGLLTISRLVSLTHVKPLHAAGPGGKENAGGGGEARAGGSGLGGSEGDADGLGGSEGDACGLTLVVHTRRLQDEVRLCGE